MSGIRFYLFGAPRLEREGNVVSIRRRKGIALLAYVALRRQPQGRETLATLLWPDFDQSRALSNLRRELSRLKSNIQVEFLQADRLQVTLSPKASLWVDVKQFQYHLGQLASHGYHFPDEACTACYTALTEAVTLHSQRFMQGFQLHDAPQYEEWRFFQAEELSRALADGLQRLLTWHANAGNYDEAISCGRRWLEVDTLHEPAHRRLMALYARAGQHAAALRQYEECLRLLEQELGVQPQQETTALYEAIRSRHFSEEQVVLASPSSSRRHSPQQESTVGPSPERYRLQEQIAVGGQGEVFLACDQRTGATVIIKRLRPELASDGERVARFLREGAALRQLDHPNIVRLLAAFEHDGHHCIVMEYVPGGTLAELLEQEEKLPVERVLALALELADALGRAHHLGIIHRDLKPGNVLLTTKGEPRLTDFGTARLAQEDVRLTQTGGLVGSPAYMSPEALRGDELDVRSDIWSFGVLLFEMLAGQRPFAGEGIAQILVRILGEPAPPLTTFRDDLPPALVALVEHMLAKEAAARPRSMREVAAALEIIQSGGVPRGLNLVRRTSSAGVDSLPSRLQHSPRLASGPAPGSQAETPVAKGSDSLSPALTANGRRGPVLPGTAANDPLPTTALVGRDQELSDLRRLLTEETYRLLTLVGPGGIGKTTLALAAAQQLAADFRDGVAFVPLASLTRPEQLAPAIAERIGLEFLEAGDEAEQLLHFLEKRHQLLLLDNFEQLLAAAPLVKELLERSPRLTILATSREPLNLSLESIYRLGGLAYPEDNALVGSSFVHLGAVELLLQQLHRQRPELGLGRELGLGHDLMLGTEEMQQVARICRLVQGMPLALVLAANWIELLSLQEIADEIAGSIDLLEADLHDLPTRQRSVRAVFNGSWQMLDEAAQVAMARLSVFRGPFSRPAAEAVAGCSLPTLRSLLNKSWLQRHQDGFELHELVRQYATLRLQALPGGRVAAHAAHAAYYGALLQAQFARMKGPTQEDAFRLVRGTFDQAEAAWRWLIERGELAQAVEQLLPALYRYCEGHARASELIPLLQLALASPDAVDPYLRAILLVARGAFFGAGHPIRFESPGDFVPFYWEEGNETWSLALQQKIPPFWHIVICYSHGRVVDPEEAIAALEPLLASLRAKGEEWLLAFGLQHLALLLQLRQRGEDEVAEAVVHLSEALAIMDRLGDGRESGYTLRALGHLRLIQQQLPEAITHWREALVRLKQAGDWVIAAQMHWHIGDAYLQMGQLEAAFSHYHTMSETALAHGNRRFAANVLSKESYEAARYGRFQQAMQRRQQALELAQTAGNLFVEAWCTWEMGELYRLQGNLDEATIWFERSLQLFNRLDDNPGRSFYHRGLADIARTRGEHELARVYYQKSLQEAETNGHGWAAAYALGGLGYVDAALNEPERAAAHCVRALTLARETSDRAISLAVLSATARALVAIGNPDLALEIAAFVADHPVSWYEVRRQAQALQETISLSPSQLAAAHIRARQQHTWQLMVDVRLALADAAAVPVQ